MVQLGLIMRLASEISKIMPIMLALWLMLLHTYYAKNYAGIIDSGLTRPQSNMLKNLPKMLLGISQKFPLLCLDFFLLCSIMLTVIIAVRYVYTHNLYN